MNANFNGHDLDDYLRITSKLQRNIGRSRNNELVTMGRGQRRFVESTTEESYITMPFMLRYDLINKKRALADIFNVNEPVPLWFEDEPDKYYLAIPDGEVPVDEIVFLGKGTIKFLVPDGVSHSFDERSFPFQSTSEGVIANVTNNGTDKTPIDIRILFGSDAKSIGIVGQENIVQYGTPTVDDQSEIVETEKVMNDDMGTATRNLWTANVGRIRHNYDNGENTSKILGSWQWNSQDVTPSSYGSIDATKPGYWHGPTLTRMFTEALDDFEAYHRVEFKPTGTSSQRPTCQGLLEINYSDADNNFVIGFEMKDTESKQDRISYSFFVGDYRIFQGYLPTSVLTKNGGFFGTVMLKKIGNTFFFRLSRVNTTTWKEEWTSSTKSWINNTVAMLPVTIVNIFASKWKNDREMSIKITHTRITQYFTEGTDIIPFVFYEGDNLFVDGETNRVYINGIRNDDYRVNGSDELFWAPNGQSEYVAISDGSFTGNLAIKERYV